MKELDALMKALEEEKVIKSLLLTTKFVPIPEKDPEKRQKLLEEAVKETLTNIFAEKEALGELFGAFAVELGMQALIKELDIKAPEKPELLEKFMEFLRNS